MGQSGPANDVPLKSWAAPFYWQPNQLERENAAKSGAQIQFSPNATSNTALIFVAVSPWRLVDKDDRPTPLDEPREAPRTQIGSRHEIVRLLRPPRLEPQQFA
jgi:hypothetical protein